MKSVLPFPVLSSALFAAWLALAGELSVGQALLAGALAFGVPLAVRPFLDHLPHLGSARTAARFALLVTWDIVLANIAVARLVLGPVARLRPVFVQVPLDLKQAHSIALLACVITMTPGTVSANLAANRKTLLVHALDCTDPDALVADIKQRYERPLMEIFGC